MSDNNKVPTSYDYNQLKPYLDSIRNKDTNIATDQSLYTSKTGQVDKNNNWMGINGSSNLNNFSFPTNTQPKTPTQIPEYIGQLAMFDQQSATMPQNVPLVQQYLSKYPKEEWQKGMEEYLRVTNKSNLRKGAESLGNYLLENTGLLGAGIQLGEALTKGGTAAYNYLTDTGTKTPLTLEQIQQLQAQQPKQGVTSTAVSKVANTTAGTPKMPETAITASNVNAQPQTQQQATTTQPQQAQTVSVDNQIQQQVQTGKLSPQAANYYYWTNKQMMGLENRMNELLNSINDPNQKLRYRQNALMAYQALSGNYDKLNTIMSNRFSTEATQKANMLNPETQLKIQEQQMKLQQQQALKQQQDILLNKNATQAERDNAERMMLLLSGKEPRQQQGDWKPITEDVMTTDPTTGMPTTIRKTTALLNQNTREVVPFGSQQPQQNQPTQVDDITTKFNMATQLKSLRETNPQEYQRRLQLLTPKDRSFIEEINKAK